MSSRTNTPHLIQKSFKISTPIPTKVSAYMKREETDLVVIKTLMLIGNISNIKHFET